MNCSPQRYFGNHRNLIATALLTPSDVHSVDNAVIETQVARGGTARAILAGTYTGLDDATFDILIDNLTADTKLASAPVFVGSGSESLTGIDIGSAAQQNFTLECSVPGTAALAAKVDIEGMSIIARAKGTDGNGIRVTVDESALVYGATTFSLLTDLKVGDGSAEAPLKGPEYDWQTATVGADAVIPDTAKRLVFDGDESNVYVQFKKFADGDWQYFLVPAAKQDYPAGTKIKFVTGSRTVEITDGATTDTLPDIVTVYDFLAAVKTLSTLCDVEGVVADDRTPTGQSARELNLHTIARHGYSTGSGSKAARGFANIVVDGPVNTELITADCIGVTYKDLPGAYVGHEAWTLKGSVSGDLGTIYTGVPYAGAGFSFVIPQRLPPTQAQAKGKISVTDIAYVSRTVPDIEPPICFGGALGPNAVDQTLTLTYTARPTGDCLCDTSTIPDLNGPCLGTEGGSEDVSYQDDTIARLKDLRDWYTATVRTRSNQDTAGANSIPFADPFLYSPIGVLPANHDYSTSPPTSDFTGSVPTGSSLTLRQVVDEFEKALALIDPLAASSPAGYREAGVTAWDAGVVNLKADVAVIDKSIWGIFTERFIASMAGALTSAGISPLGKSSASTQQSGDGCWQDLSGEAYYWTVVGSDGGAYAPLFNNTKYVGSRKAADGKYYSTREFALFLAITCVDQLKVGDVVTVTIGNAAQGGTYQIDDQLLLPLIAAQDLYLTGGRAASRVQTWFLKGDVEGPFAPYIFDPDAPSPYPASNGLTFLLVSGAIDPGQGDRFTFGVEGGQYVYRKNGGGWSSALPILDGAQAFADGLTLEFVRGAVPSFVDGDLFSFRVLQQWKASNLMRPNRDLWYPGAAAPSMKALFDSIQPITGFAIAYHTLPSTATIEVKGGDVEDVVDWTESIPWRPGPIAVMALQARTAIWCRLEITGAGEGAIGWWWAGVPDQTMLSAEATPRLSYKVERSGASGLAQSGSYLAKSVGVTVEWSEGSLLESDVVMLTELVDHVKSHNDEPIVFMPNATRPDAMLAQVVDDEIPLPDIFGLQPNAVAQLPAGVVGRRQSARLSLQGVWG